VLPAIRHLRLGLIPYFPIASGFLTGKYRRGEGAGAGRLQFSPTADRLLNDAKYPNRSRKLTLVGGNVVEGPATPYQGFGGYFVADFHARYQVTSLERYRISWLWGLMTARARAPAG